jgi:phosphoribosyl 1,2-cyclic phosphate phosphodiesterase
MKITILGCGSSGGVPLVGNNWGTCDPNEPRNRRLRVSILVQQGDTTVLVDTSPDLRQQLLACDLQDLTAVLYTHAHADHCHGIDELRAVNWLTKRSIPVYADAETLRQLEQRFPYIFAPPEPGGFFKPAIEPHLIEGPLTIGGVDILPFEQDHTYSKSLGFRFGDFAYSTDVKVLDECAFEVLRGVKIWVVDAVREEPHRTHSHLAQTLEWIERVKPQQAYLTHMNDKMDYASLCAKLPPHIRPAYDGLVIEC